MKKIILIIIILIVIVGMIFIVNQLGENDSVNTIDELNNIKITYSTNNNMSSYNSKYTKRGVYYDTMNKPDAPHFYTIAMGEKNTGGYSITIKDVNIDAYGNVEVIVKEDSPKSWETVTMAFTYPTCMLELDELPNSIIVKNTDGILFKNINF